VKGLPNKSPADRVKAKRLRELDPEELTEDQAAWLEQYEATQKGGKVGRSASSRLIHIEEQAAAEGDHVHPDAYAAVARADGLRADTLFRLQSEAWQAMNAQMMQMFAFFTERTVRIEEATAGILEAARESFIARTQAEGEILKLRTLAELRELQANGDDDDEFMKILNMVGAARAAVGKETAAEKKAKKGGKVKPMGGIKQR
jgi:hypothetical protein